MDTMVPGQRLQELWMLDFRQSVVTEYYYPPTHAFPLGLDFQSGDTVHGCINFDVCLYLYDTGFDALTRESHNANVEIIPAVWNSGFGHLQGLVQAWYDLKSCLRR